MFEPFGQLMGLPPSAERPGERGTRLYRVAIVAFWLLVCTIIVARMVLASHGGLFAFGS